MKDRTLKNALKGTWCNLRALVAMLIFELGLWVSPGGIDRYMFWCSLDKTIEFLDEQKLKP